MNRENRTSHRDRHKGEPIDALLGAYFRAEMPSPWPAFRSPAKTRLAFTPASAARRPAYAGRLALAASVGLLFVGSWMLPTTFAPRAPQGERLRFIGDPSATKGGLLPVELHHPDKPGTLIPEKVKSSLHLEQGADGRTGVKITVEEYPSPK